MSLKWDDHRYFLAIARAGSLTAAARALGVSQPTVSRRLEAMERTLSARLFERTQRGYELTPVGTNLYGTVERVEEALVDAERQIYGEDQLLTGPLKITCTEIFLNGYLSPHIWPFLNAHPGVALNLTCTDSLLSLSRSDADLALRFTQTPPDTLAGRRLTSAAYGVYGAASARDSGVKESRETWEWIGFHDDLYNRLIFAKVMDRFTFKHQVDSVSAIQSMVRAGLGVSMLPCYIADRDEGLVRLHDRVYTDPRLDLWLLYHPEFRRSPRVRLFADFIVERVTEDSDLFEGKRPWCQASELA